jgi:Low molecular weight phosphotyrosine protein phosphatase
MGSVRTVVFVCQHGAAKSVLAAALLERLAAERGAQLRVLARGTEPEPAITPAAAAGLLAEGIDVRAWHPRPLTSGDLAQAWRSSPSTATCPICFPPAPSSRCGATSRPWPTASRQPKR